MKRNKKMIVAISIIMIVAVIAVILAYLYIATDLFRNNKELFSKYISQNKETFKKINDNNTIKIYKNLKNERKYESNTNIEFIHSEGGEISNPFNNLSAKLDIQKDDEQQYLYMDGQILYDDEKYVEAEIIKENEQYGIRFTDAVIQFVTIKLDENTKNIATDIGTEASLLELLINAIDGNSEIVSEEQLVIIKDKYLNIITNTISNGTFGKQKNAMITYNNATTKTNAYSVELSSQQVQNMLLEILNNMKNETEIFEILQIIIDKEEILKQIDEIINNISEKKDISSIKITVYEQKQKTIRTVVELGLHKITIENTEQETGVTNQINYSNLSDGNTAEYNVEMIKTNAENQENFEISADVTKGEDNYTVSFSSQMQLVNDTIEMDVEISQKQDITTKLLKLDNTVSMGKELKKEETLTSGNYLLLSAIKDQTKRKEIIDLLKKIVPEKTNERIDILKEKLGMKGEDNENINTENLGIENTEEMPQVEINKFNAKFEFYTGETVSAENVKTLLGIVKNNVSGHAIGTATIGDEEKCTITLYIEKEQTNEESTTKAFQEIEDNKKYKVSISYKEENGLIDYIIITEV